MPPWEVESPEVPQKGTMIFEDLLSVVGGGLGDEGYSDLKSLYNYSYYY